MSGSALRRIKSVEVRPGYRLGVTWDDGTPMLINLASDIKEGGVFGPLRDEHLFGQVQIDSRRRVVSWPNPSDGSGQPLVDIDADALFRIGLQQRSESFFSWLFHRFRATEGSPAS